MPIKRHNAPVPAMFPVMNGVAPATREDQIAGIVQRVWADSLIYHEDVEPLLREWRSDEHCIVTELEFSRLLTKARTEFGSVASVDATGEPACPAYSLVSRIYEDVEQLERAEGLNAH